MSSSISNSEAAVEREGHPGAGGYFLRSLGWLGLLVAVVLGASHVAGRFRAPSFLGPDPVRVSASEHYLTVFGNSRTRAAIDVAAVARSLGTPAARVDGQALSGGGWDALHFYMLALLTHDELRPGRDAVIIEVSPLSMNDADSDNRLTAIRPETAFQVAALPGAPIEMKLDLLTGGIAGLYRGRFAIQSRMLWPKAEALSQQITEPFAGAGLLRDGPPPRFDVVPVPGRELVIDRVEGDVEAFNRVNRRNVSALVGSLEFGGYKLAATRRAVETLRARGIDVVLLRIPSSRWFEAQIARSRAASFDQQVGAIAKELGAYYLHEWPEQLQRDELFWDETHMRGSATAEFSAALGARLGEVLGWNRVAKAE